MKKILIILAALSCLSNQAPAQTRIRGLPKTALVLETRRVPSARHPNRMVVLWMVSPGKYPNSTAPDDIYTCPEYTRGSYYSGPVRVTLVSTSGTVFNTLNISQDYEEEEAEEDTFDLPYAIRKGYYYRVPGRAKRGIEAKPNLIWFRDYNGDGKFLEFALFDAPACMGLQTTLIGYSEKNDRVIQYPISMEVIDGTNRSHRVTAWADYLFSVKPRRPGYWQYDIDYRGRGGSLDKWEVRYNVSQERFEAKLVRVAAD